METRCRCRYCRAAAYLKRPENVITIRSLGLNIDAKIEKWFALAIAEFRT
jgi:hypothetical protein